MMLRVTLTAIALCCAVPAAAQQMRELTQNDLRASVASGASLELARLLEIVGRRVQGEAVDVRAFQLDRIYYRLLILRPNGQIVSVVVDAASGRIMPNSSAAAQSVRTAAQQGTARGNSGTRGRSDLAKSGGLGNGNSGQGNNNAGGNGGGNSGGGNSGGGGGGGNSGGGGGGGNSGGGGGGGNSGGGGGGGKK